ncbi:MAG TPA: endonuclease domain-containing protein [Allosphingosinicella sp.]|jgi:very-short-patch-repair endonuclease|nr:endonuclease domain-containing protein [Allosphingosinicella sp.]
MSPPVARLWQLLRTRPDGHKFRRQHRAAPYTLDFYCHAAALAIEVDGASHDMGDNPRRDERGDAWMTARWVRTLRFLATDIRDNLEGVAALILDECASRSPPPATPVLLPGKGRGGEWGL